MVRHIAGMAEIVDDVDAAVRFYEEVLRLPVRRENADYAVVDMPGILHFGIWSRRHAAGVVFKDPAAASRVPLGFTIGFEVDTVDGAVPALRGAGLVQAAQDEPWGQRTARFMSPSGALCEVSETPWARRLAQTVQAEAPASGPQAG